MAFLLFGCNDKTVNPEDELPNGTLLYTFSEHTAPVWSMDFHPSALILASGSGDKTIKFWDLNKGQLINTIITNGEIDKIVFSPDGQKIASGSRDSSIYIWQTSSGNLYRKFEEHNDWIGGLDFSNDGNKIISGDLDGKLFYWSIEDGAILNSWNTVSIFDLKNLNSENEFATGGVDKITRIWNVNSSVPIKILEEQRDVLTSIDYNPNRNIIASSSNYGTVNIWSTLNYELIKTITNDKSINAVAFNPHKNLMAIGGGDSKIYLIDLTSYEVVKILEGHTSAIYSLVFSSDGSRLASGSWDNIIKVWFIK